DPVGVWRQRLDLFQLCERVIAPIERVERLRQEQPGDDAAGIVGESGPQVLFRFALAAAEESRHLKVPAAQRAVGRSLLEALVDSEDLLELVADVAPVL